MGQQLTSDGVVVIGILGWLFGKPRSPRHEAFSKHADDAAIDIGFPNYLQLPSRNFFGPYRRSPNERYILAWRDGNDSGTRGGARHSGSGRFILFEDRKIVAEGRMARPNDGKVADNGIFILNDWGFMSDLSGIFFAFRPDGKKILSRRFKANLYNNGLSANGRLAVCQTCNSPDPDDSSVLTIFDLSLGKEIASWIPESGWAHFYEFPPDGQTIRLGYPDRGAFTYSLHGEFIDRVKWADVELGKGNLMMVERLLKLALGRPSAALTEKLINSIDVALRSTDANNGRMQAWGLKLRGMCLEAQNNPVQALACYQRALALDPKIGLKRRADQLRKALAK